MLDGALTWRQIGAVAQGADVVLSPAACGRVRAAREIVESIVAAGARAYGITTGVGALCDVVVDRGSLARLSRNIVMSHAVGVGTPLGTPETRAIIAAAINQFSLGHSGVRLEVVDALATLLRRDCIPEVPADGSVGYLTHMAHIALLLLGAGTAHLAGKRLAGAEALRAIGLAPLVLEAKEGLSLVNGTPCASGLAAVALLRAERLLDWADAIAALTFENLRGQLPAFDAEALALRRSPGLAKVGEGLRSALAGSARLADSAGLRTQDALSLRAIPHVHGAARDVFEFVAAVVDRELESVTDNPAVSGGRSAPRVLAEAHAVGAAIGLAMDTFGTAAAQVAALSERRLDRLVNPLVSGLPAFLAADAGAASGFMIAQYTAVSLTAENRRLAAPASLDGGVTSALQEDFLCHATPAALKALKILDNLEIILAIELLAAGQAWDLTGGGPARAPRNERLHRALRAAVDFYRDDRPLADDIERTRTWLRAVHPLDLAGS